MASESGIDRSAPLSSGESEGEEHRSLELTPEHGPFLVTEVSGFTGTLDEAIRADVVPVPDLMSWNMFQQWRRDVGRRPVMHRDGVSRSSGEEYALYEATMEAQYSAAWRDRLAQDERRAAQAGTVGDPAPGRSASAAREGEPPIGPEGPGGEGSGAAGGIVALFEPGPPDGGPVPNDPPSVPLPAQGGPMSALAELWGSIAGGGRPPTSALPASDSDLPANGRRRRSSGRAASGGSRGSGHRRSL